MSSVSPTCKILSETPHFFVKAPRNPFTPKPSGPHWCTRPPHKIRSAFIFMGSYGIVAPVPSLFSLIPAPAPAHAFPVLFGFAWAASAWVERDVDVGRPRSFSPSFKTHSLKGVLERATTAPPSVAILAPDCSKPTLFAHHVERDVWRRLAGIADLCGAC